MTDSRELFNSFWGDPSGQLSLARLAAKLAKKAQSFVADGAWMPDSGIPVGWDERDAKGV